MANIATTTYIVTGSRKAVRSFWQTLQKMEVFRKDVWLDALADFYGIDLESKGIDARGYIDWAEYEEDEDSCLLTFETETKWDATIELFQEINHLFMDEMSISYRVCECGCQIYYVHDEGNFFTEECCVTSMGEPFEDACDDVYGTVREAINEWCEAMKIEQGERTDDEMVDFINEYKYEDDSTYYQINTFSFV